MKTIDTLDNNVFKHLITTIGALPTSFIDSMSYYEMIAWLVDYLKKEVIPAINNNAEAVKEIQEWIDTLDLSAYVGEKIEEMAADGELATVIAQIVDLGTVFGYDNIAAMAAADNLTTGSICRVLGNTTATNGDGAFYRVRALLNTDVIDGVNKVTLTNTDNLIAVRIPDAELNTLAGRVSTLETKVGRLTGRKFLFIGDSYGTGQNELQEQTTPWITLVAQYLGLTYETDYWKSASNGSGFNSGYGFKTQLQDLAAAVPDVNAITDIVIVGGYNDRNSTIAQIDTKMNECFTYAKTTFPNAQIMLASVGWSKVYDNRQANITRTLRAYSKCGKYGVKFLKNMEWALHDYSLFSGDNYHPNQDGQNELAAYLADAILTGSCDIQRWAGSSETILTKLQDGDTLNPAWCLEYQNNGEITVTISLGYLVRSTAYNIGSGTKIPLAVVTDGLCLGGPITSISTAGTVFVATSGGTGLAEINGEYSIEYDSTNHRGILYWTSCKRSATNNNIVAFNTIPFSLKYPAAYC